MQRETVLLGTDMTFQWLRNTSETLTGAAPYGRQDTGRPRPRLALHSLPELAMSVLLKALALRLLAGRTIGGVFSLLLMLMVPLAGVLKFIGLPILIVLGILGAPIFLLLAAVGLPVAFVVGMGGVLLLIVGSLLAVGLVAIKVALPIILIVWLVKWLRSPRHPAPPPAPEPGLDAI